MGASPRFSPDRVLARAAAFEDEWTAVATCTEPADRARAEAAIRELYATGSTPRPAPQIVWAGSPQAGAVAYRVARMARKGIVSEWATDDLRPGATGELRGLADPFGLEPVWVRRQAVVVRDRLPEERRRMARSQDPILGAAQALGLTTFRLSEYLATALRPELPIASYVPEPSRPMEVLATALGPVWEQAAASIGPDLAAALFAEGLGAMVRAFIGERWRNGRVDEAIEAMQPGQWDAVTPVVAASRDVHGTFIWRPVKERAEHERLVELRLELARSAGPWWALEGLAIIADRPLLLRRDDRGRPHAADGPAIAWPDGAEAFAWHGVAVRREVITAPETITVAQIDAEVNVEVRRSLIERFGIERFMRVGGARLADEDETGRLWRREFSGPRNWRWRRDEPIVMVEVQNSTPEPDGSRRTYFLRVPPQMRTAREAVAWTFGLGAAEYAPQTET